MNAPFYQLDAFSYPTAMALATLLGVGFGFVLERSGFARSPVLAAQFYGRDNRILKVMFTAVATAVVGVGLLSGLGVLELSAVKIPETWLYPQLAGGFLLGVGFLLAGYCPGTAVCGMGAGYLDAFLSLVGLAIGGLVFGFAFPLLQPFYESSAMGVVTLPELLHISWAVLAAAVVAMAIGAFLLAEWGERKLAKKDGVAPPPGNLHTRNRVFGGLVAATAAVAVLAFVPKPAAKVATLPEPTPIGATELARQLAAGTPELYIVDTRSAKDCEAKRIPGALCIPEDDRNAKFIGDLPATRPLVLYGQEKLCIAAPRRRAFQGHREGARRRLRSVEERDPRAAHAALDGHGRGRLHLPRARRTARALHRRRCAQSAQRRGRPHGREARREEGRRLLSFTGRGLPTSRRANNLAEVC